MSRCGQCCRDCGEFRHDWVNVRLACRKCYVNYCGNCGKKCSHCMLNLICGCPNSEICSECIIKFLLNKYQTTKEETLTEIKNDPSKQ